MGELGRIPVKRRGTTTSRQSQCHIGEGKWHASAIGARKLLCQQCAGDQAAQEVTEHKGLRATVGFAQRDDTPKSKGWHNVVRDAGTGKLGGDIRKCLGGLGIIEDNTENFCREAREAWGSSLARTAKVDKGCNVLNHDGHRRLPHSKIGVQRGVWLGGRRSALDSSPT